MNKILLVEPDFPYPVKSKNKASSIHKNFVPVGLLKLASLYRSKGYSVELVRGKLPKNEFSSYPKKILVTSIFTYWSKYVWDVIIYYRSIFPESEILLGGIYATLHSGTEKFNNLVKQYRVEVHVGLDKEAENFLPDYSFLPGVDYHATHMMRGCIRRCSFCGTWKIEPERTNKSREEIISEIFKIGKNKVIFYDNNILANPNIKNILAAFRTLRINDKLVSFESQSGFDGRLLEKDPELGQLIKQARFQNIRIAWDNGLSDKNSIKMQIEILNKAGFKSKDISVFMIYNFNIPYEDMLRKIEFCKKLGVQITDCRYRPLGIDYDGYNPHSREKQTSSDYYIHDKAGWTDQKVRDFRSRVRVHNIWVRYARDKGKEYDKRMEKWSAINNTFKFFGLGKAPKFEKIQKSIYLRRKIMLLNKLKIRLKTAQELPLGYNYNSVEDLERLWSKWADSSKLHEEQNISVQKLEKDGRFYFLESEI